LQLTDEALLEQIRDMLSENFDIDRTMVNSDSRLYEDLELDSIDAVDMAIRLQQMTGKRIKAEDFKNVRTVADVVVVVRELVGG
jgi:acyl carrier protein